MKPANNQRVPKEKKQYAIKRTSPFSSGLGIGMEQGKRAVRW